MAENTLLTLYDRINALGAPPSACVTDYDRGYHDAIEAALNLLGELERSVPQAPDALLGQLRLCHRTPEELGDPCDTGECWGYKAQHAAADEIERLREALRIEKEQHDVTLALFAKAEAPAGCHPGISRDEPSTADAVREVAVLTSERGGDSSAAQPSAKVERQQIVAWLRSENELCDCAARSEGECACGAWYGHKEVPLPRIADAIERGDHLKARA